MANNDWQGCSSGIPQYGRRIKHNCAQASTQTTGFMPSLVPTIEDSVKPYRSKIEIREMGSVLMSDVRISPLKRIVRQEEKYESWPIVFYSTPKAQEWTKPNSFLLRLESQVHHDKDPIKDEVWYPFSSQDVESVKLVSTERPTSGKKFQRIINFFEVNLSDKIKEKTPYIQFYCEPKTVKYHNSVYKTGDIITIVIGHPEYPIHWPTPPLITVKPTDNHAFVPLLSKQRLCVITDLERHTVDYDCTALSTIKFVGKIDADFGKQCNIFNCNKPTNCSETIYINSKSKKKTQRKIIIPMVDKDPRCPIISPQADSVIHSTNIDRFIIRFYKDKGLGPQNFIGPIVVMDQTPITCVRTIETANYFERRFEIDKRRPFFYIAKKDNAWVLS